ncbi:hypothetical protein JN27_06785 [Massilia sp. BSC265]|nr:hypothetical protein JN27_06785 [Massilia sp. BSC265]
MALILALQLAAPLLLIFCIAFLPLRGRVGFGIQATATAAVLSAIALAGLWTVIPWWTPYAYGVLLVLAIAFSRGRAAARSIASRSSLVRRAALAFYVCAGGFGLYQAATALYGRIPPREDVVDLAFPLRAGRYVIANGGASININAHMRTLDPTVPRFLAWRGQSYGVDIVQVDPIGFRADGLLPSAPTAYRIYGAKVFAPCSGTVVFAIDGVPDMRVPETDRAHMLGNAVILRCAQADVVLAHLRPGSIRLAAGDRVDVGALIGEVGNSGNSDEPHLHIHAQSPGSARQPMSGKPLPVSFGAAYLVRNDRVNPP